MSGTGKSNEEIAREAGERIERMVYAGGWGKEEIGNVVLFALREARQQEFDEVPGFKSALTKAIDFAERGWSIIANANGGNWQTASKEWQDAAAKYRDQFHNEIRFLAGVPSGEVHQHGTVSSDTPSSFGLETPTMEVPNAETGLAPCPFCGNKGVQGLANVWCSNCGAQTEKDHGLSSEEIRMLWNRRAPLISPSPQAPEATSVSHKKQSSVGQPKEQQKWTVRRGEGLRRIEGIFEGTKLIQSAKPGVNLHKIAAAHNVSLGDEQKEQQD